MVIESPRIHWSSMAEMALSRPIVRIITRLGVGGAERYVCSLSEHVDRKRFASTLICGRPGFNEREWSELTAKAHLKPIYLNEMRRGISAADTLATLKLAHLLRRLR